MSEPIKKSILCSDLVIVGDLKSEGEIEVFGKIKGNIVAQDVAISEQAYLEGNVSAKNAVVLGSVKGNVMAKVLLLVSTASILGDVHC
ncbi:MAG: polymer-forming cytoskeletal protein, partial [Paracoccaceae bacterium]